MWEPPHLVRRSKSQCRHVLIILIHSAFNRKKIINSYPAYIDCYIKKQKTKKLNTPITDTTAKKATQLIHVAPLSLQSESETRTEHTNTPNSNIQYNSQYKYIIIIIILIIVKEQNVPVYGTCKYIIGNF